MAVGAVADSRRKSIVVPIPSFFNQRSPRYIRFLGPNIREYVCGLAGILVDSNSGQYIVDHDVHNPAIPTAKPGAGQTGYVVYQKGRDLWNTGVTDISRNQAAMREYAENHDIDSIEFPEVDVLEFERP